MIQDIYNRLTSDQAFAEELKKFVENKKIESAADEAALLVEFANSQGYDVTADDVQAFVEKQYKALSEEELEKINAAGAGGFCFVIGWGWNEAYGAGWTKCSVIGGGLGVTWKDSNAPGNEFASQVSKKLVAAGAAVAGGAKSNGTSL